MASQGAALQTRDAPSAHSAVETIWPKLGIVLAVSGLGLFWWQFAELWLLWTTDSLRSIGALAIPTSAALGFRALHREDFDREGSWWGLALVALAVVGANLQYYGSLALFWNHGPGLNLMPTGLVLYLYASGAVVLLGGARAWYKVGFALLLLLFVNPTPSFFSHLVDLPLQQLGAKTARSFAHLLGVPVRGPELNLMFFHDELGMFVAPSCNGLQAATAMGALALVIGHLRGLGLLRHTLFVTGAVAVAYVFNLLRLCLLVLYYFFAHLFPTLAGYAVSADYAIGAMLFTLAATFLFGMPWRQEPR